MAASHANAGLVANAETASRGMRTHGVLGGQHCGALPVPTLVRVADGRWVPGVADRHVHTHFNGVGDAVDTTAHAIADSVSGWFHDYEECDE